MKNMVLNPEIDDNFFICKMGVILILPTCEE